jgi:hypothetical protein
MILAGIFSLGICQVYAGYLPLRSDVQGEQPQVTILQNNEQEISWEVNLPGLELSQGTLEGRRWDRLTIPGGGYYWEQVGTPELPNFTRLLAIPATAAVQAQIEVLESSIIPGLELMPAQGLDPEDLATQQRPAVLDAPAYARNAFFPERMVQVGEPALLRGLRVVTLQMNPIQYNSVTRETRVAHRFRVTARFEGQDLRNIPARTTPMTRSWANLVRTSIINFDELEETRDLQGLGPYLIVAENNTTLLNLLGPLADWKRRKGHAVTIQTFSPGANNTTIKSLIQNAYNTWPVPPEYVLLAGNTGGDYALPGWSLGLFYGYGDHQYSQLAGNDILADVALGRFPADNSTEMTVQVNKILWYEKTPYTGNTNWYHQGVVVAGSNNSGISTVQTNRWIKTRMIENQYTRVDTMWYYLGGSVQNTIVNAINNGVLYMNYRGWIGMEDFDNNDIENLNNGFMLPFCTPITCESGGFGNWLSGESPMECFFRVGTTSVPKGAIGAVGMGTSTTNTRCNNILNMGIYAGIYQEGITQSGNALSRGKLELYYTYHQNDPGVVDDFSKWSMMAGDPGTELFTKAIQTMTCSVPDQITFGVNTLTLNVTEPGVGPLAEVTVCLYKAGELQVVDQTDANGQVTLPLNVSAAGNVKVTILKQNFAPIVDSLNVVSAAVAIGYQSHTVDDDNLGGTIGDNDDIINPGETVDLPLTFKNYGTSTTATGISTTTSESDPYATLSNAMQTFPDMAPGATGNSGGSLHLVIGQDCPDGYTIPLAFNTTSGQGNWSGGLMLPVLSYDILALSTTMSGSDSLLSPGETANFVLSIKNQGHKTAASLTATMTSLDPLVTVNDGSAAFGTVAIGATANCTANPFNLTASVNAPVGHPTPLRLVYSANNATQVETLTVTLGVKHSYDPQGPDEYGYYCFDNTDANFTQKPTYAWVECDPSQGGTGTVLALSDPGENQDASINVALPFTFRYYGENTNTITVCSNGWISTHANISFTDFRNYPIPSVPGPVGLIAPFWDDLTTNSGGRVCTRDDAANHRFIVEWSRMPNLGWPSPPETFEVILLDPAFYPTPTGDGEIIFQYNNITEVYGYDSDNGFSTIGIETPDHTDGIEVVYWNTYDDPSAAHVQNGRAYKFTTAYTYAPPVSNLDVTLTPVNPPIVIPASGGSFNYNVGVTNNGSSSAVCDGWIMQYTPGGTWQGPMLGPVNLNLPAGITISRLRSQNVPGSAAPGVYTYRGYVGLYSTVKWDSSSFSYTKSATGDGPIVGDWDNWGESFAPYETSTTSALAQPEVYHLDQNRPNPFNPATAISYQLAVHSHVSLRVYDTAGRLVSELINNWQEAGSHQVTFDGSKLASGLYFVRMQAGDFTAVQKMMLLK